MAAKHLIQVQSDSVRDSVSQNSKMLPPSKRFKMENSIPVHQNGIETPKTGTTTTSTPLVLHTTEQVLVLVDVTITDTFMSSHFLSKVRPL